MTYYHTITYREKGRRPKSLQCKLRTLTGDIFITVVPLAVVGVRFQFGKKKKKKKVKPFDQQFVNDRVGETSVTRNKLLTEDTRPMGSIHETYLEMN